MSEHLKLKGAHRKDDMASNPEDILFKIVCNIFEKVFLSRDGLTGHQISYENRQSNADYIDIFTDRPTTYICQFCY